MIIYVDRTTTARASTEVELDHHCSACGKTSTAWVIGRGSASSSTGAFGHRASDVQFMAETEAQRDAAAIIRLVRCPYCEKRDPAEMRAALTPLAIWPGSILAASWLLLWGFEVPLWLGGSLAAVTLLAIGGKLVGRLRGTTLRVRFLREAVPSEPQGPYRT
jgi:hypothetical protein